MTVPELSLDEQVRELRGALEGAVEVLAAAGYSAERYRFLTEGERASPLWAKARRVWEAVRPEGAFIVRYGSGTRGPERAYTTLEAALAAAVDSVEEGDGCPESIESGGTRLMDRTAILGAWEDRHDPG